MSPNQRVTVLVIEDQPVLRLMAVDMIEDAGFEALEARGAKDALRILEERDDVRIVFSDIDLGTGGDGLALAHAIRDRWPPIEIIVVPGKRRVEPDHLPTRGLFFDKPYQSEKVTAAMHRMAA